MATSLPPDRPSGPKNTVVSATGEKDSPAFPHPTYNRLKTRREKCRALMGETEEIRAGREAYLIRYPGEDDDSYEFRLKLVAVTNFFKRAVFASVGLLLEKPPALGDDMPQKLKDYSEDITLGGKHVDVYARELTADHIVDGFAGTLVDYPRLNDPTIDFSKASLAAEQAAKAGKQLSSDDEQRLGLRPFFVKYTSADILKIVEGKIGGVKTKILVVLRETAEELDGEFGIQNVVHYRVFKNSVAGVTWERWEGNKDSTETTRKVDPTPLMVGGERAKKIPFSLFGEFDALPPLENLADLNIEHFNLKTNRRNIEDLAMVPTQVRIGAGKLNPTTGKMEYPPIELGTRRVIEAPYPPKDMGMVQKPVYWHSPDVSVLEPSRESLQDTQSDIGTAALNFLAPEKRAAETATSKRIGTRAERASLTTVGRGLKDHLEECYGFAAPMIREKSGGTVTIDLSFEDTTLSAEEMRVYLDAVIAGELSSEEFLEVWKRGKRLDPSLDVAKERERILKKSIPPKDEDAQADGTA